MKPIHCFGDSHLETLIQAHPDLFIGHGTTSVTAYKLGEKINEFIFNDTLSQIPKGNRLLLSFGEIDCSLHIIKYARRLNKPIEEVTAMNIAKYQVALEFLKKKYTLAVFGPYPYFWYSNTEGDTEITHIGTFDEVLDVKAVFNDQLEYLCEELGIFFFTLYDEVVANEWYKKPGYYRDNSHLGECMIPLMLEKLKDF